MAEVQWRRGLVVVLGARGTQSGERQAVAAFSATPRNVPGRALPRLMVALATLIVFLLGAVIAPADSARAGGAPNPAAAADGEYRLAQVYAGDPMHVPVLMYRHRHTMVKDEVSWERNVAVFNYTYGGVELVAVGSSIDRFASHTKTALIDVYRREPHTGQWVLSDPSGKPLMQNGRPVDWRASSTSSIAWDVSQVQNVTLQSELRTGLHSERVVAPR